MEGAEPTPVNKLEAKQLLAADGFPIRFDVEEFKYDFDPLGRIYHELTTNCKLIINLNIPNEIIQDIVGFLGYTESKLGRKASSPYVSNSNDCEMCFLLSMPYNSPYNYKYTLSSFATHVKGYKHSKICFKIGTFVTDEDTEKEYKELYCTEVIDISDTGNAIMPDEYQSESESDDEQIDPFTGKIMEFKDLNIKLSNNSVYVMRVDVVSLSAVCAELLIPVESLNKHINPNKIEMVCDRTRFCYKEYRLRTRDMGKLYEIVLY